MRGEITLGDMVEAAFIAVVVFYVFLRWNLY